MKYFNKEDFKNLWKVRGDRLEGLPFPGEEELLRIEQRLGVKLPASYLEFCSVSQNGGSLKRNAFPLKNESGEIIRHVKITHINPIGRKPGNESLPEYMAGHFDRDFPNPFYDRPNLFIVGNDQESSAFEFFVLNYLECGKDEEPSVAFITRKVRSGKPEEPSFDSWRHINETYYWELQLAALKFDDFIKSLVVMPKLPPFDFENLSISLKEAVKKGFQEIVKTLGEERLIAFGLYLDYDATFISPAGNFQSHLDKNIANYPNNDKYFIYSINEWCSGGIAALDLFEALSSEIIRYSVNLGTQTKISRFRNQLVDCAMEVLAELKKEGFFEQTYKYPILLNVDLIGEEEISKVKAKKIREALD